MTNISLDLSEIDTVKEALILLKKQYNDQLTTLAQRKRLDIAGILTKLSQES